MLVLATLLWGLLAAPALAEDATVSLLPSATESAEAAIVEPAPPRPKSLLILHTNDTYGLLDPVREAKGWVGGATRQAVAVRDARREGPILLLCAGNVLGPGSSSAHSKGDVVVRIMNRMGYDAWLPSNHDFSYGVETLKQRIREASFPTVLANVRERDTGLPLAPAYTTIHKDGLKIAVIGLTDPRSAQFMDFDEAARLEFLPPLDVARALIPVIRDTEKPDLVIALTHLSLDQEMPLLAGDSGVDLVIGGFHSPDPREIAVHQVVGSEGKRALHAGGYGTMLGRVRLSLDPGPSGIYRLSRMEPELLRLDEDRIPAWRLTAEAPELLAMTFDAKRSLAEAWRESYGDSAKLSHPLDFEEVMRLVAEIMRQRGHAEVGIINRSFFQDDGSFGKVQDARALYYAMPWEDAFGVVAVRGKQLATLYQSVGNRAAAVGISKAHGQLQVNGRPLDPESVYMVATTLSVLQGKVRGLEGLAGLADGARKLPDTIKQTVMKYFKEQGRAAASVDLGGFPDYSAIPFWKSSLVMDLDFQRRAVDRRGDRYPDLTWKGDKSGLFLGGDLNYRFGSGWGPHDLWQDVKLSYRTEQLSDGKSQVSSDRIQLITDYQADVIAQMIKPFVTLTLSTRFNQEKDPKFFLGQLGSGFSHQFPWGLQLREGIEFRRHFFPDPKQPDTTGATLGLLFRRSFWGLELSTDLKLFSTLDLAKDGVLTDGEVQVAYPLTRLTALSYKINLYNNTRFPDDWATRHMVGLSFRWNQPWVF